VRTYKIPQSLVVNTDQTGIQLVPMAGERTWEKKGSKAVGVIGGDDKRSITACVSSAANGALLLLQFFFSGTTNKVLPKTQRGKSGLGFGFHYTKTDNHWSNFESIQDFVNHILIPYLDREVERLNLLDSQNMVWLIDCWSVHTSVAFRDWMSKNHPHILVLYVPANCTAKFQQADVVLQRPLKCVFANLFKHWSAKDIRQ
jgi:hypothetical protein